MIRALEDDERVGRLHEIAPLAVGARHMGAERPELRGAGVEQEGDRVRVSPSGPWLTSSPSGRARISA